MRIDSGTWWASQYPANTPTGGAIEMNYDNAGGVYTQGRATGVTVNSVSDHQHTMNTPSYSGGSGSAGTGSAFSVLNPFGVVTWLIKAA